MSRSPSRSPAIQDAWTTCVALCARAWQRPQCATRVPSRAKWKLRFAPCGSIGVQPRLGMSKYQLDRIKGEYCSNRSRSFSYRLCTGIAREPVRRHDGDIGQQATSESSDSRRVCNYGRVVLQYFCDVEGARL